MEGWKLTSSRAFLADVGDEEIAGLPVEAEAPGVAKAVGPDLRQRALGVPERIRRRNRVRRAAVHVEPQDLSEEHAEVLRAIAGIAAATAVPEADVQVAIGTERELSALVVGERLRDVQEDLRRSRVGHVRIGRHAIAHERGVARGVRVVDVEQAVRRVVRMEGEAEQAALAAARDERAQIEKRRRQDARAVEDFDAPRLLEDEEAPRAVARVNQAERGAETGDDWLEAEGQLRVCSSSHQDNGGHGDQKCRRQPSLRSGGAHAAIIASALRIAASQDEGAGSDRPPES